MKKVVMLEESDYNTIMNHLSSALGAAGKLRYSSTSNLITYHLASAISTLKDEDSSVQDLKDRIDTLEGRDR